MEDTGFLNIIKYLRITGMRLGEAVKTLALCSLGSHSAGPSFSATSLLPTSIFLLIIWCFVNRILLASNRIDVSVLAVRHRAFVLAAPEYFVARNDSRKYRGAFSVGAFSVGAFSDGAVSSARAAMQSKILTVL
jgi:hypothetical protein